MKRIPVHRDELTAGNKILLISYPDKSGQAPDKKVGTNYVTNNLKTN